MTKPVAEMTDAEVLAAAGPFGPAIIGQELFDRARRIRTHTDDGRFGPALLAKPAAVIESSGANGGANGAGPASSDAPKRKRA